jgi:hypothetical protein
MRLSLCSFKYIFRDSSMVEHAAVNRRVVGSSPTRGAQRKAWGISLRLFSFHSGPAQEGGILKMTDELARSANSCHFGSCRFCASLSRQAVLVGTAHPPSAESPTRGAKQHETSKLTFRGFLLYPSPASWTRHHGKKTRSCPFSSIVLSLLMSSNQWFFLCCASAVRSDRRFRGIHV